MAIHINDALMQFFISVYFAYCGDLPATRHKETERMRVRNQSVIIFIGPTNQHNTARFSFSQASFSCPGSPF